MKLRQIRNTLLLLLTATIWGTAFVAQSVGNEYVGAFTFNFVRSLIGSIALLPVIFLFDQIEKTKAMKAGFVPSAEELEIHQQKKKAANKNLLLGGFLCGLCLFIAVNLQQFGILYSSAGKAGFLTACYILIVPILGLFFKKKTGPFIWLGVLIALTGLFFLCIMAEGKIGTGPLIGFGDVLLIICAFVFSFHILTVDHFSPLVNGIKLSCIQFAVCGILSGIAAFIFETPSVPAILSAWMPLLYAGVMSSGIAYTLQIIGQKDLNPTIASLAMSMESVIAAISSVILLHERLSQYEIIGCVLMFTAIILAQIPDRRAH